MIKETSHLNEILKGINREYFSEASLGQSCDLHLSCFNGLHIVISSYFYDSGKCRGFDASVYLNHYHNFGNEGSVKTAKDIIRFCNLVGSEELRSKNDLRFLDIKLFLTFHENNEEEIRVLESARKAKSIEELNDIKLKTKYLYIQDYIEHLKHAA